MGPSFILPTWYFSNCSVPVDSGYQYNYQVFSACLLSHSINRGIVSLPIIMGCIRPMAESYHNCREPGVSLQFGVRCIILQRGLCPTQLTGNSLVQLLDNFMPEDIWNCGEKCKSFALVLTSQSYYQEYNMLEYYKDELEVEPPQ